jgi:hypothetical protein
VPTRRLTVGDSEGMVADFAEEFEYVSTGALPDARGVYRGPEGWTDFVGWLRSEFESPVLRSTS